MARSSNKFATKRNFPLRLCLDGAYLECEQRKSNKLPLLPWDRNRQPNNHADLQAKIKAMILSKIPKEGTVIKKAFQKWFSRHSSAGKSYAEVMEAAYRAGYEKGRNSAPVRHVGYDFNPLPQ